jgi:hypothetical protein
MSNFSSGRALGLLLLGFGIFQLLAGITGLLFWLIAGVWQPYTVIIVVIAFAVTWPAAYEVWKRYWLPR